ncbi:uncharacterized protein LOC144497672 [Mustelus asterias]
MHRIDGCGGAGSVHPSAETSKSALISLRDLETWGQPTRKLIRRAGGERLGHYRGNSAQLKPELKPSEAREKPRISCSSRHCLVCQSRKFPGRLCRSQTLVFTFEPKPERLCPPRVPKKRARRVLYPPPQVRKPVRNKKDVAKRLLLFLLSIFIFQLCTATEEGVSLLTSKLSVAEEASVSVQPLSSPDGGVLPDMFLPGVGPNYTQQQPAGGGYWRQATSVIALCLFKAVG